MDADLDLYRDKITGTVSAVAPGGVLMPLAEEVHKDAYPLFDACFTATTDEEWQRAHDALDAIAQNTGGVGWAAACSLLHAAPGKPSWCAERGIRYERHPAGGWVRVAG